MKKIFFVGSAVFAAAAILPLFAAFEAHVINVTAKIENALAVSSDHIDFGTVFPQEHLAKPLSVRLSGSFMDESRVDDVDYFIRQKPKCGVTTKDGGQLVLGSTRTGHVVPGDNPDTEPVEPYWVDCGTDPNRDADETNNYDSQTHTFGALPSLCEYISKEGPDENDGDLSSFHRPWTISGDQVAWNDVRGRLAKSEGDSEDLWTIDLAVPCFGDHCAQDWAEFVHRINPQAGDPNQWVQPIANEHKIFGCDLWVEVGGVSRARAASTTLFSDDFNDDIALDDGWSADHFRVGADGTPASDVETISGVNAYEGWSARLKDGVAMYHDVSTAGYEDIHVSYCRKGQGLEAGDIFRIGWKTLPSSSAWGDWTELEAVTSTVWGCVDFALPGSANNTTILVGFFADVSSNSDFGWFDQVAVSGVPI